MAVEVMFLTYLLFLFLCIQTHSISELPPFRVGDYEFVRQGSSIKKSADVAIVGEGIVKYEQK